MTEALAIESLMYHPQGGFAKGNGKALFIPAFVGDTLLEQRAITNRNLLRDSADVRHCSSSSLAAETCIRMCPY